MSGRPDPATLSDDELAEAMVDMRADRARHDAEILAYTAEFDARRVHDSFDARTAAAWLSH
jgi:hypothetical protein